MLGCPRQLKCRLLGRGKKDISEQLRLKERSEGSNDAQQIPEQLIYDMHFGAITNMIVLEVSKPSQTIEKSKEEIKTNKFQVQIQKILSNIMKFQEIQICLQKMQNFQEILKSGRPLCKGHTA